MRGTTHNLLAVPSSVMGEDVAICSSVVNNAFVALTLANESPTGQTLTWAPHSG